MKTITILAQKGGTGKTTLSIHLSTIAANYRKRVLIADLDPQGSSLVWRKLRKNHLPKVLPFTAQKLRKDHISLKDSGAEMLFIDTPPHSTADAHIAANLADLILIPTRPALLDLAAIQNTAKIVQNSDKDAVIVLNCCPPPTRYGETAMVREARNTLQKYNIPVFPGVISQRAAFSNALNDGRAVTEFEPKGKAAQELHSLYNWLITQSALLPDNEPE